jgi:uncharacterized protein YecE (DUF72 family)
MSRRLRWWSDRYSSRHSRLVDSARLGGTVRSSRNASSSVRESLLLCGNQLIVPSSACVTTYAKWRDSTPEGFKFSVKMPRSITHDLKLSNAREPLLAFLAQTEGLAEKRGPVLMQLPPSFSFDDVIVATFLEQLRAAYDGPVVCEPRHATWFSSETTVLLNRNCISRVVADPPPAPVATGFEGRPDVAYFRLHGSPRMYWSRYGDDFITALATTARSASSVSDVWCIFDNTASGAAIENAWELNERLNVGEVPCDRTR